MKPAYDGYHGNSFITQVGRWLFNARLVWLEPEVVALTKSWLPAQRNPSTIITMGPALQYTRLYTCSVRVGASGCLAVVWRLLLSGQNTDSSSTCSVCVKAGGCLVVVAQWSEH